METQHTRSTVTSPLESVDVLSLLRHARAGDREAFRQLVQRHQARVFGMAWRLTGQRDAAEDAALDVFIRLYAALPRITSPAHLGHWLSRAVSQRAMHPLRAEAPDDDAPAHGSGSVNGQVTVDPGADFTARVLARVELRWSHRRAPFTPAGSGAVWRRRGRVIVTGAVVLVVIAAAWLVLRFSGVSRPPVAAAAPRSAVAAGAPDHAKTAAQTAGAEKSLAAGPESARPPAPPDADRRYIVIAMPPRHESQNPAARAPVEAFYAALLDGLRRIPGVVLLIPGVTAPPETGRAADFLLTVSSLDTTALAAGGVAFHVAGGASGGSLSIGAGQQWPVEIRMQSLGPPPASGFSSAVQIGVDDAPASLAAKQVEMLRLRFFPDAMLTQQLLARFRDDSLPGTERERALSDLLGLQLHGRGAELDATSVLAIVQQATLMRADQRALLWRSLRGLSYPELVEPLLDSLRRDLEDDVRFEALATLAADHGNEPRVRAAIEAAARDDPQQVLRMAARRALHGAGEWRGYVLATLRDASLPYADRLAPLLLMARSAVTPAEIQEQQAIVDDAQTLDQLAALVRDGWFDTAQEEAVGAALGLLANSGNPAAPDLLVQVMQQAPKAAPAPPAPAARPTPQISPATLSWLLNHRNDPRVRRMLDDIARGNPDPRLDAIVELLQRAEQTQRGPPRR